jgi:hypothetical protein
MLAHPCTTPCGTIPARAHQSSLNPERTCDAPGDDHSVFKVVALIGLRMSQQRQAPISIESRREAVTCVVPQIAHAADMNPPLKVGDLLRCPHCRRWHPVVKWQPEGTAYTQRMLYFECNGQRFYAGQEDLESRHETRAAMPEN